MPARNPKAVRQRAIDAAHKRSGRLAIPRLDPVFVALNHGQLPVRARSGGELARRVRRAEVYVVLGARVVVELHTESHAAKPSTRGWAITRRAQQSFQAMGPDNAEDVRAMVRVLGAYGPVMLAHYAPGYGSRGATEGDLRTILDGAYLRRVARDGLFALSFMENDYVTASEHGYELIRNAVRRYGGASP